MPLIRDDRQMWMDLPERLPYGTRYAPAPLPLAPVDAEAAWWAAHRARSAAMDAEWCELGELLLAGCLAREQQRMAMEAAEAADAA